jgi:hypothetical protein
MPTASKLLFAVVLLFSLHPIRAQQITVSGTVTDNFDVPLFGVNILVEGTRRGTTTNSDGAYQITAAEGETLVFSYLGFISQRIVVGSGSILDIILQPGNDLEEVVVIGYGTTSRKSLTDNIVSVNSEQIKEIPVASFQGALVGKTAGVQITQVGGRAEAGFKIRVRGVATINGNQEPLYVIDGIPVTEFGSGFEGQGADGARARDLRGPVNIMSLINPADIESRVNMMTAEEIEMLNRHMDELAVGGDVLGVILIIFIVFVITDVIGATDIFPFIKPVN